MRLLHPTALAAISFTAALAATPECRPGDLACRVGSILHLLYVVAIILGILLLAVIALALHVYRRNKHSEDER